MFNLIQICVCVCVCVCVRAPSFNCVLLFVTPWTVAFQAPLPMVFSSKNIGVGCHFLLQRIFLTQESNPHLFVSLAWAGRFLTTEHVGCLIQI